MGGWLAGQAIEALPAALLIGPTSVALLEQGRNNSFVNLTDQYYLFQANTPIEAHPSPWDNRQGIDGCGGKNGRHTSQRQRLCQAVIGSKLHPWRQHIAAAALTSQAQLYDRAAAAAAVGNLACWQLHR